MPEQAPLALSKTEMETFLLEAYKGNAAITELLERLVENDAPKDEFTCLLLAGFMNLRGDGERAVAFMRQAFSGDRSFLKKLLPPENPNHDAVLRDGYAMVSVTACPVCASEEQEFIFVAVAAKHMCYHVGLSPYLHWVQCAACTHVYTREQNPVEALLGGSERATLHSMDQTQERYDLDRASVAHLAEGKPGGRVFEIGPGNGRRMAALSDMGMQVTGMEIQEGIAEWCREQGLDVSHGDFLVDDPPGGASGYEAIILGDVIEHLPDVHQCVAKLGELLKSDGLVWISTPIYEDPELVELRGTGLDPYFFEIEHWHYFTGKSVLKLMAEHGFRLLERRPGKNFLGTTEFTFGRR